MPYLVIKSIIKSKCCQECCDSKNHQNIQLFCELWGTTDYISFSVIAHFWQKFMHHIAIDIEIWLRQIPRSSYVYSLSSFGTFSVRCGEFIIFDLDIALWVLPMFLNTSHLRGAVFILGIYRGEFPPPKVLNPPKVSKLCKTISLKLLVTGLYAAQNGRQLAYTVTCISVSTVMLHGIKVTIQHQGVAA